MSKQDAKRWAGGLQGAIALVVVCLAVYLPGLWSIAPIDRDESRFAQASRQMFEAAALPAALQRADFHDGGWVVPKVQDRARLNKPPLIYWLQVASAWIFTGGDPLADAIWMYRIPSVLCSTLAVLLVWWIGRAMFDPRAAWLGAAMLAICPVVVFDAHQARADQLLLATVAGTQGCLWWVWKSTQRDAALAEVAGPATSWRAMWTPWGGVIGLWICLGLSVLAKGPIGPMIAGLTCLALCVVTRRWSWLLCLRPLVGVLLLAAIVGPWVWMVGDHVGWSKYLAIVYDETIGRSTQAKEGHWAPPGYHTVLLAVLFWPGSMMTALGVKRAWSLAIRGRGAEGGSVPGRLAAWWRSRKEGRDAELFCLAWIIPSWIVFECVGTKLPHYTLPMYPAIALLSARMLLRAASPGHRESFTRMDRIGFGAWWLMGLVLVLGSGLALALLWVSTTESPWRQVPLMIAILVAFALLVALHRIRPGAGAVADLRRFGAMALLWCAVAGIFMTFIGQELLPGSATQKMMALVRAGGASQHQIASEYHEDSLIFATRGRVERLNRDRMLGWLGEREGRVAIVRGDGEPFFVAGPPGLPPQPASSYRSLGQVEAFPGGLGRAWVVMVVDRGEKFSPGNRAP